MAHEDVEDTPDLSISPEKVCYIIAKAREFDAKDVVTDPNDSSNPTDDGMVAVLEDHRDDPVVQEIAAAIFAMTEIRIVLRELLRRVELGTTTARDERQRVKHVVLVPHRGARVYVRSVRDAATSPAEARLPGCPVTTHRTAASPTSTRS